MTASTTRARARRNGEGSIRQLPDGRWEVRYQDRGKRVSRYTAKGATESQAIALKTELLAARDHGVSSTGDRRVTVKAWMHRWYDVRVAAEARPATLSSYRQIIRRIDELPIGRVKLVELRVDDVSRFVSYLKSQGFAPLTIRTQVAVLRAAVQLAVKTGDVSRNVVALAELPKPRTVTHIEAATAAEVGAVLKHASGLDRYALAYALGAMSGLRLGEVLALRYRDLDVERGIVNVRHSWSASTGELGTASHLADPKSETSKRRVPMMSALVPMIAAHVERDLGGMRPHPDTYVFHAPDQDRLRPVSHRSVQDGFTRACKRAGVRTMRFHDLRHGFAVYCLDQGVGIDQVSAWLGHSGIGITAAIYGHRDAADAPAPRSMVEVAS